MGFLLNVQPGWRIVFGLLCIVVILSLVYLWRVFRPGEFAWQWVSALARDRHAICVGFVLTCSIGALMSIIFGAPDYVQYGLGMLMMLSDAFLIRKRCPFVVYVGRYEKMPRFYGVAWCCINKDGAYCAPVPLNILIGTLRNLWWWLKSGWRRMPYSPHEAYRQGRRDMLERVIAMQNSGDCDWFERLVVYEKT